MDTLKEVKEMLGEEFDVREVPQAPWVIEIGLRLQVVTQIHRGFIFTNSPSDVDMIVHERDKILIEFKRKLNALLWKYLGEKQCR